MTREQITRELIELFKDPKSTPFEVTRIYLYSLSANRYILYLISPQNNILNESKDDFVISAMFNHKTAEFRKHIDRVKVFKNHWQMTKVLAEYVQYEESFLSFIHYSCHEINRRPETNFSH